MRVGVCQFEVVLGAREENLRRIAGGLRGLDVELLVLPELCTSGYLLTRDEAWRHAIEIPGEGLAPFVQIAKELNACVVVGIVERAGDSLYNSTAVVGPEGWLGTQRKVHLTRLEKPLFASGEAFHTFAFGGLTLGVVTCFDAWFPEACRQLTRDGAQLLCQPAAFGGRTTGEVMRVRALENHVFAATANRLGREARGDLVANFRGESQIVDCDGQLLASAQSDPAALTADIDISRANEKANAICDDLSKEWIRYYEAQCGELS